MRIVSSWSAGLLGLASLTQAIQVDLTSTASLINAAKVAADGMMYFYNGNKSDGIPGLFPPPYYWWEAGAAFGTLVDYWYYTGNSEYNSVVTEALLFQVGPKADYMPPNQTKSEGNDDQGFWGLAAMSAAEVNFPNPPSTQPQWLALAQAVFNSQALRWDPNTCNGGLRWQIFTFNNGYNYKNSISNGCFFQLAARLARYTGNQTYADWADKTFNWMQEVGLMSTDFKVFDGTDVLLNCSQLDHIQWSYNGGAYLLGAAMMYNYTKGSQVWANRVSGILQANSVFFSNSIMYEVACERNGKCNVDQRSFKAYLSRWMALTTQMAPFTKDTIMPLLQASARGAAASCTGNNGNTCGLRWDVGSWDSNTGVGEQMSAMSVFQANLIGNVPPPFTSVQGGTSQGDPAAGTTENVLPGTFDPKTITTGSKAGAGILTFLALVGVIGGSYFMVT